MALQHGQLAEAQEIFEEASKADSKNPYVWTSLAETYLREKQHAKAEAAASKAEQLGGADPVIAHALVILYFNWSQELLESAEFTKAADVASSALKAHPADAQLTLALGVARYGQRRFDDSITEFLKVIQLNPEIEQPYVFLSRILDQAGPHLGEITTACEAWAARNPQSAKAQLVLAKALLASNHRNARTEALLRRSVALDGNLWESHYELGVLLAGKREYKESAAELTRSIELDPKQPMPHYH